MSMFTSSLTWKRWKILKKGLSYVKSIVLTVTVFNKTQTLSDEIWGRFLL